MTELYIQWWGSSSWALWDKKYPFIALTRTSNLTQSSIIRDCSTMWVGCQSRRFLCLFWRETRQRILGPEISPYPEVVRGREWELAGLRSREELTGAPDESSWRLDTRELAWNHGQGQSTPDSGDSSREDRVQRQGVKMSLIPVALWNFR